MKNPWRLRLNDSLLILALAVIALGAATQIIGNAPKVKELTLSDGTKCVVLTYQRGGGNIDCDWTIKQREPTVK